MTTEDAARGEDWRAFAREETRPRDESGGDEAQSTPPRHAEGGASAAPGPAEPAEDASRAGSGASEAPKPTAAGAKGRGAERVSIRSVGRRVRVVGDYGVASVTVSGPHVLRRSGNVLEVASEGQATPLENFSLLKLPRSLDDLKNLGLGTELVVTVNPRLIVDAEVTASGLSVEGVPNLGRIRVSAGGVSLKGVRQVSDLLVQMGTALVEGPLAEGRSKVKCESGGLTVNLTDGANVTVRGTASMGRITWPGDGIGAVDEWIVGNGSGRLDIEVVMGMGSVRDASAAEHQDAPVPNHAAAAASGQGGRTCPTCHAAVAGGKFCAECGAPLASSCAGCGASLPPKAKFCPECGRPA